jgi:hypothetical protein
MFDGAMSWIVLVATPLSVAWSWRSGEQRRRARPISDGIYRWIDRAGGLRKDAHMAEIIYPRSPREMMSGWVYLPRFVDKIRLHLAGKLHPDYQENFTKGFDGAWLKAAGVTAEQSSKLSKIRSRMARWRTGSPKM